MFLLLADQATVIAYPPIAPLSDGNDAFVAIPQEASPQLLSPMPPAPEPTGVATPAQSSRIIVMATANAQTLKEQGKEAKWQHALGGSDASVIGVQETRQSTADTRVGTHFTRIYSAATAGGLYGCGLWFRHTAPTDGPSPKPPTFAPDRIKVLASQPRWLAVVASAPQASAIYVSLHAPCRDATDEEHAAFWDALEAALAPSQRLRLPIVALMDANARVGSVPSVGIGDWMADEESYAGAMLRQFIDRHDMILPSTFQESAYGPQATW